MKKVMIIEDAASITCAVRGARMEGMNKYGPDFSRDY